MRLQKNGVWPAFLRFWHERLANVVVGLWTALSPRSGAFLKRKWAKELDYRLKKELSGFRENRMAVGFEYEWHDHTGQWFRRYGNELWQFNEEGLMSHRYASINNLPIEEEDRYLIKKAAEAACI